MLDQRKLPTSEEYVSCSSPEQVSKKLGVHDDVYDENIPYLAQYEQFLIAGGGSDQVNIGYWCPCQFLIYLINLILVQDVPKKVLDIMTNSHPGSYHPI